MGWNFSKKLFHVVTNFTGQNVCGEVILNEKTNDQIINSSGISKVVPCSVFLMLTLTRGIDILFEKLTSETGG